MSNEQKYSIMTVKDMFWRVISSWKLVAVLTIIGLIAGALYSGRAYNSKLAAYNAYCDNLGYDPDEEAKALKASETEQRTYADKRAESWKKQLSASQLSALNACMSVREEMARTDAYIKNAIIMQVDPYNIDTLSQIYEITSNSETFASKMAQNYNAFVTGDSFIDAVATKMGWKNSDYIFSDLVISQVANGTQLKITLFCPDRESLEKAESVVTEVMTERNAEFVKQYGSHGIERMDSVKTRKADNSIVTLQNNVQTRQQSYNTQIVNYGNTFKNVIPQQNYYNYMISVADGGTGLAVAVADAKDEKVAKPSHNRILFALAGAFAGAVIAVVCVLCGLLISGKLLKSEEMITIFGLPYMGSLISSKKQFIIDKLIKKAVCGNDGPMDLAVRSRMMAERIAGVVMAKDINEIVIVGSEMNSDTMKSIEKLSAELTSKGVKVKSIGNMISNPDVSEDVIKGGCVLILETIGKSSYKSIEKELSMLEGCGVKIIGAGCVQ